MFISQKGYTIPKDLLSREEKQELIKRLTFAPLVTYGEPKKFYAYRESDTKFYVPRFYGNQHFGTIPFPIQGKSIDVSFTGTLREPQKEALHAFMKEKHGLLELPCGFGKTILALCIIHLLKVKTIVIVHKEFLMEQWIERIHEFLPGATIGRIQGDVIDSNKDVVIGMLQSISMKQYPKEVFQEFGFTIIDETHHIAAETFSNALFKLVTPYILGLSATMERKDGLTKVFKLFIGDIVYSSQREKTEVFIHKVLYKTDDLEYNDVLKNFRGETNFTGMINKVSEYHPRTESILHILQTLLKSPTNKQVMILAHTRSLLKYLYDAIEHRQIGTVGYYVGGMKQKALKESEEKQIIIATFSMAEEALDIKTLTTLILATSKNDVTQAVGRILRVKHERPLVIDMVDTHQTFQNQWKKRRAYYNSQGYTIIETTHDTYPIPFVKTKKCLIP